MSLETVANIVNGRKISFFDQIIEILEYLNTLSSHPHLDISEEVNVCVQKVKKIEEDNVNLNILLKLQFIIEQLRFTISIPGAQLAAGSGWWEGEISLVLIKNALILQKSVLLMRVYSLNSHLRVQF